jgi:hypothetical protein
MDQQGALGDQQVMQVSTRPIQQGQLDQQLRPDVARVMR